MSAIISNSQILKAEQFDEETLYEFRQDALELIEVAEESLLDISKGNSNITDHYDIIFNSLHSLKGSLGMFQFERESKIIHSVEDIFKKYKGKSNFSDLDLNAILSALFIVAYKLEDKEHEIPEHVHNDIKHFVQHDEEQLEEFCHIKDDLKSQNMKLKILIIDDDEDYKKYLKQKLSNSYAIHLSSSSEEGLMVLKDSIDNFNVIICDFKMPKDSGLYLMDVLNTIGLKTPVVIVSENPSPESLKQMLQSGVYSYFDKSDGISPIKILLNKIRRKVTPKKISA